MLRFKGVLFERLGNHGARVDRHFDVPWTQEAVEEVFAYEEEHVEKDNQRLWSAARYKEGANRGNAGLEVNYAAVLDSDCCDPGRMDEVCEALRSRGLAFAVYTSWSHGRPDKHHGDTGRSGPFDCFRVVIPYHRDATPGEHAAVVAGLFGHEVPADPARYAEEVVGRLVTLPSGRERAARPRGWDPVSARPSQGFYVPAPFATLEVHPGAPLEIDDVLRRPTTPRASTRIARGHQAPTPRALGALGTLQRALASHGFEPGPVGFSGWQRVQCPSCQDPSPSVILRANGDGIDLHCFAGCKRKDVLNAIALDELKDFAPPSELRQVLEEQLQSQTPREVAIPVSEAVERLTERLAGALQTRTPTVFRYPAGTGKATPPR